ncbi:MAG: carbon storage regulator [Pirellulaceae bacterium]|nr:carbon storage regulator [Pirellulaceae bacterium]
MLVLTRKQDEAIVIDGQITIRVLQLRGNRIRLGIEAPPDVVIRRGELAPLLAASGILEAVLAGSDSARSDEAD